MSLITSRNFAYKGKLSLPNRSLFENITTNLNNGILFNFYDGTSVPTVQGYKPWKVILRGCEGITTQVKGLSEGSKYFGVTDNIDPKITIYDEE